MTITDRMDAALAELGECLCAVEAQSEDAAIAVTTEIVEHLDNYLSDRQTLASYSMTHLNDVALAIEAEQDPVERMPYWGEAMKFLSRRAQVDFELTTGKPFPLSGFPG